MTTEQDQILSRITSYIKHNAAKEPDAIKDLIQKGHDQLVGLLDGLSQEQANFKPGPDHWSVLEVLRHVLPSKRSVPRICAALARGETPAGLGDEQSGPSSLAEAQPALAAAHDELLAFVDGLSPQADLEARYEHPFFGPLNCREWAAFQRVHDGDHANQIEQIKAASGFPA